MPTELPLPSWSLSTDGEGSFCVFVRDDGLRAYVDRQDGDDGFMYLVSFTSSAKRTASVLDVARIQQLLSEYDGPVDMNSQSWGVESSVALFSARGPRRR